MTNKDELNMRLRSYVLAHSIRQERTTSNILKSIFRILKDKTKTLGNKSSNLSFKNKIDLLHDLGDLDDTLYSHLLKFMEIRNQFAHNHECSSFLKLGEANPDLTNHLKNKFKNEEKDEEKSLFLSYNELFKVCQSRLTILQIEYAAGIQVDFRRHIDHVTYLKMDKILKDAIIDWRDFNKGIPPTLIPGPIEEDINNFIICFRKVLASYRVEIADQLENNYAVAFTRKKTMKEIAEDFKSENAANKVDKTEDK